MKQDVVPLTSEQDPSRRSLIALGLGASLAGGFVVTRGLADCEPLEASLIALGHGLRAQFAAVGAGAMTQTVASLAASGANGLRAMRFDGVDGRIGLALIEADLAAGRWLVVDGWILAETEFHLLNALGHRA